MTRMLVCLAVLAFLLPGAGAAPDLSPAAAYAEEDWKTEFDDVCGRTAVAMALTRDEVKGLIERCDRLKPQIEKLDESAAKVYQARLKRCRELFVFVLEALPR